MLRVGLVGAGYWAALNHAPMHAQSRRTELVGVWARPGSRASAEQIAAEHGVRVFDSYDEMLGACDAVDFAVPPAAQADLAIRAAEAGRHLLLEKPVAGDLAQAERLLAAIDERGVASVVGLTRRFAPVTRDFVERARALGAEGTILGAQGTFLHGGLLPGGFLPPTGTWRSEPDGALQDLGSHLIDLAVAALGPVREVSCTGGAYTTIELIHDGGVRSQLAVSMSAALPRTDHRLSLFGTHESLTWDKAGIDDADCWREICDELAAAAEDGAAVTVDAHAAVHLQRVLEAAGRALRTGRPETVGPRAIDEKEPR